ncbi:MAG: hypothetical protein KDB00_24990 [Planctomycetales bacterium]|nr:hypothetical protein [Planctomycetales bacterium]
MIVTTLLAFQQGFLLQFQGRQRWEVFALTSLAAIVFVAAAILTSCKVPKRQYRESYLRPSNSPENKTFPAIEVRDAQ